MKRLIRLPRSAFLSTALPAVIAVFALIIGSASAATLDELKSAIYGDDRAAIREILSQSPSLLSEREYNQSALDIAASAGNLFAAELLLELGVGSNPEESRKFIADALYSAVGIAVSFSSKRAEREGIIRLLIGHGADPDGKEFERTESTLHIAARGNVDPIGMINILLSEGADLRVVTNDDFETVLHVAAEEGEVDVVHWLIVRGLDVNARDRYGRTPLHMAVEDKQPRKAEKIALLINGGALVDALPDAFGERTALNMLSDLQLRFEDSERYPLDEPMREYYTTRLQDQLKGVKLLIENGANVNTKDSYDGNTPLHLAARRDNIALVKLLLSMGADVTAVDRRGYGLIPAKSLKMTEILVAAGAIVNDRRSSYETPLIRAIKSGNVEIVKLLINKGADVNLKDASFAKSPLYYAKREKNPSIESVLITAGAQQ